MDKASRMWRSFKIFLGNNILILAVSICVLLILSVSANYFSSFPAVRSTDQAIWGQFGDYFGGVLNPLLSFFALVGLMVTLRSQQAESKKSEKRHEEALFDARLFQLLTLSHSAVSSVKILGVSAGQEKDTYDGHRAMAYALNRLQEEYLYKAERGKGSDMYRRLLPQFERWKRIYWPAVASYIESMLYLIQYAIENSKGQQNMEFALRAVFAQMSSAEKLLIFYVMIFSKQYKIMIANVLHAEYLAGAADDNLKPYRQDLLHSAILERLATSDLR